MTHYIDKSALVAEIEKKINYYEEAFNNPASASYEACLIAKGKYWKLLDILQFLNTLEVKEEVNTTDVFIHKAKEAFCKATCNGHPPRSTCTSLGTCKEHDNFVKFMKGE